MLCFNWLFGKGRSATLWVPRGWRKPAFALATGIGLGGGSSLLLGRVRILAPLWSVLNVWVGAADCQRSESAGFCLAFFETPKCLKCSFMRGKYRLLTQPLRRSDGVTVFLCYLPETVVIGGKFSDLPGCSLSVPLPRGNIFCLDITPPPPHTPCLFGGCRLPLLRAWDVRQEEPRAFTTGISEVPSFLASLLFSLSKCQGLFMLVFTINAHNFQLFLVGGIGKSLCTLSSSSWRFTSSLFR